MRSSSKPIRFSLPTKCASPHWRRATYFIDRIFKGAKPTDLPIEQPTAIELVVNLRTAKTLGIRIPDTGMARTDRIIE
jgi:putative ABC transport system substrate-binding protein